MSNVEHLVENGIEQIKKSASALDLSTFLSDKVNTMMLEEVSVTKEELYDICLYIVYTHDVYQRMDIIGEMEEKYGYKLSED